MERDHGCSDKMHRQRHDRGSVVENQITNANINYCRKSHIEDGVEALLSDQGKAGSTASQCHGAPRVSESELPKKKTLGIFFKKATVSSATPSLAGLMKRELSAYLQSVSADNQISQQKKHSICVCPPLLTIRMGI